MRRHRWLGGALLFVAGCSGGGSNQATAPGTPSGQAPSTGTAITDAAVSALARAATGWTFYKNRPDTLSRAAGSGHSETRLRTRYNARAATQLDAAGKVRSGADFPDSSLIVKELIVGGVLSRYAIMMKLRGATDASAGSWLWAYYAPDGSTQIGIASKGTSCTSCHSLGLDYTRMNDSHP